MGIAVLHMILHGVVGPIVGKGTETWPVTLRLKCDSVSFLKGFTPLFDQYCGATILSWRFWTKSVNAVNQIAVTTVSGRTVV